jgi:hypothetical protein
MHRSVHFLIQIRHLEPQKYRFHSFSVCLSHWAPFPSHFTYSFRLRLLAPSSCDLHSTGQSMTAIYIDHRLAFAPFSPCHSPFGYRLSFPPLSLLPFLYRSTCSVFLVPVQPRIYILSILLPSIVLFTSLSLLFPLFWIFGSRATLYLHFVHPIVFLQVISTALCTSLSLLFPVFWISGTPATLSLHFVHSSYRLTTVSLLLLLLRPFLYCSPCSGFLVPALPFLYILSILLSYYRSFSPPPSFGLDRVIVALIT